MAHFDYTVPGGNWANVATFTPAHAASLDQKTFKSVNGDDGGVWTPLSFIEFGGAGVKISGTAVLETSAGGRIQLGNNDFPVLKTGHTGKSRTLAHVLLNPHATSGWSSVEVTTASPGARGNATTNAAFFALEVHQGATLDSVDFRYAIQTGHGALPANFPSFAIAARYFGNGVLQAIGSGSVSAGNVALYENGGAEQSFNVNCGAHVVDRSNRYYYVIITDENGSNSQAGNEYRAYSANFGNIPDMRFA